MMNRRNGPQDAINLMTDAIKECEKMGFNSFTVSIDRTTSNEMELIDSVNSWNIYEPIQSISEVIIKVRIV